MITSRIITLVLLAILSFGLMLIPVTATTLNAGYEDGDKVAPASEWCDHFTSSTLDHGWTWIREDPSRWSLTDKPGYLQIMLQHGDLYGSWNHNENTLIRPAPAGDFELLTSVTIQPTINYQQAGLIVYQDDDHYIRLTRVWNDGARIQFLKEDGASITAHDVDCSVTTSFLIIQKKGNDYTGYWSADGKTWDEVYQYTDIHFSDVKVGLVAFVSPASDEIPAEFDFICVIPLNIESTTTMTSTPTAIPTPTSTSAPIPTISSEQGKISDSPAFSTFDENGNLYLAYYSDGTIIRITPGGEQTTYATGIDRPRFPVFDSAGNLYVGSYDGTIQKISPDGTKTVIASGIWSPQGMGTDSNDNLYVACGYDGKIYKISPSGSAVSVDSGVKNPKSLVVTKDGGIYYADTDGLVIQYITPEGNYASLANVGKPIKGMTIDGDTLYVSYEDCIAQIDAYGKLITVMQDLNQPTFFSIHNGEICVTQKDGTYVLSLRGDLPISPSLPTFSPTQAPAVTQTPVPGGTSSTGYHEATITHSGFDFSLGDTGEYPTYDGEIINWQPSGETNADYPRDSEFVWWRNTHLDDTTGLTQTKDMGKVEPSSVAIGPVEWDKTPNIPPLLVGHTIVAKCADGYVKFQVLSIDSSDWSARVRYWYSPGTP